MKDDRCKLTMIDYYSSNTYTFLDVLKGNSYIYYSILEEIEDYKLKNILRFIFLRILKIHKKFPNIPLLNYDKKNITKEYLNTKLKDYINNNKLLAVLILQSLFHYRYPKTIKK